jgi:hypothetical protein
MVLSGMATPPSPAEVRSAYCFRFFVSVNQWNNRLSRTPPIENRYRAMPAGSGVIAPGGGGGIEEEDLLIAPGDAVEAR